jgi:hypothetical protein
MPLLHRLLPPLALALLPGCIVPIPLPPGTPGAIEVVLDEGDSCGARGLQQFVGQDRSVVEGTTIQGPGPVRILAPGDVIGSDQDPTRANVRLDSSGKVAVVDCG